MAEITPFKDQDIAFAEFPNADETSRFGSDVLRDVKEMQVGVGADVFRADRNGIWLGASTFADAPFSVDMQGNVVATSLSLGSLSGDLDDIADGAVYKKTTENEVDGAGFAFTGLNSSGEIIKGFLNSQLSAKSLPTNGVRVDTSGIYGRKSGSTTFYINSSGDAYFSGDLVSSTMSASSISGGTIVGTTITGGLIQTSSSGLRTVLDSSDDKIKFMNSSTVYGYIEPITSSGGGGISIDSGGEGYVSLTYGSLAGAGFGVQGGTGIFADYTEVAIDGDTSISGELLVTGATLISDTLTVSGSDNHMIISGNGFVRLKVMSGTTADGLTQADGSMYVRSSDNVFRIRLGGTWRSVTTT